MNHFESSRYTNRCFLYHKFLMTKVKNPSNNKFKAIIKKKVFQTTKDET